MQGLESLLVVTLVAALTPMIVAVIPGPGIPQVVVLILAGVLIGPQGLGLAETSGIELLANVGLGFLRAHVPLGLALTTTALGWPGWCCAAGPTG